MVDLTNQSWNQKVEAEEDLEDVAQDAEAAKSAVLSAVEAFGGDWLLAKVKVQFALSWVQPERLLVVADMLEEPRIGHPLYMGFVVEAAIAVEAAAAAVSAAAEGEDTMNTAKVVVGQILPA